jgi:hypothetical protein
VVCIDAEEFIFRRQQAFPDADNDEELKFMQSMETVVAWITQHRRIIELLEDTSLLPAKPVAKKATWASAPPDGQPSMTTFFAAKGGIFHHTQTYQLSCIV